MHADTNEIAVPIWDEERYRDSDPRPSLPRFGETWTLGLSLRWTVVPLRSEFAGGHPSTHVLLFVEVPFEKRWTGRAFDLDGFLEPGWLADALGLPTVTGSDRRIVRTISIVIVEALSVHGGTRTIPSDEWFDAWQTEGT